MVRHVVLFRFDPETPASAKQAVRDGLTHLEQTIPEIRRYQFGDDLQLADGNFDFAVVADFDSEADYRAYAGHPEHQRLVKELVAPILSERVAVQYEI